MITLCSVIYGLNNSYLPHFLENISSKTKLINEISLCNLDYDENYCKTYTVDSINVHEFGLKNTKTIRNKIIWEPIGDNICAIGASVAHSFAMLQAIEMASNPFVFMSDPDVLFYTSVDQIYYDLIKKYDLKFVGAAHHVGIDYCCRFFPNVVNMLVEKKNLPPKNTFDIQAEDLLSMTRISNRYNYLFKDNYLCPGNHRSVIHKYPNPKGHTDTGMLLYAWNEMIQGKWLSFLTPDIHTYSTQFYRTNFNLKSKFPKIKLLHHATHAAFPSDNWIEFWNKFLEINKEIKSDKFMLCNAG